MPESGCSGKHLASGKSRLHKRLEMSGSSLRFRRVNRLPPDSHTTLTPSAPGIGIWSNRNGSLDEMGIANKATLTA